MSSRSLPRVSRGRFRVVLAVVVVLLLAASAVATWRTSRTTNLTLHFTSTQGLHTGDEVRILGVKVGKVGAITPRGGKVQVEIVVSGSPVPVGAKAVIIAPTLVGGRYVQLAPGYTGGPRMVDGDVIGVERTAVPVEWDKVRTEVIGLAQSLGPTAANPRGALADALSGTRAALEGNGANLGKSVEAAARAASTLAASSGDFFATVQHLNTFIGAMNRSEADVLAFARELAAVSDLLTENRVRIRELLRQVSEVVTALRKYVRQNKTALSETAARTKTLLESLQDLQVDLANILHLAPNTLANFYNIYDPSTGAFTGRPALPHGGGLSNLACQAIYSAGGTLADCQQALGAVLDQLPIGELPIGLLGPVQGGTANQSDGATR